MPIPIPKAFSSTWEVISKADTAISAFGWAGVAVSFLISSIATLWGYFVPAPWYVLLALFFIPLGILLTILLSILIQVIKYCDYKREKSENLIRERYANFVQDQDNELLDFQHDGEQAMADMLKLLNDYGKEMKWVAKKIKRHGTRLNRTNDTEKRYKLITNAGSDINLSATRIRGHAEIMRHVNKAIRNNVKSFLEALTYKTEDDMSALKAFVYAFNMTRGNVNIFIESVKNFRSTTESLTGKSKHLTSACKDMHSSAGLIIKEMRNYLETCDHLEKTVKRKLSRR